MSKKTILVLFTLLAVTAAGFAAVSGVFAGPQEVTVSAVKGNPGAYVGKVSITGLAGTVHTDKGVIEMVDEKACCAIYLLVPTTAGQQQELQIESLYQGDWPQKGQPLVALGEIRKTDKGFSLDIAEVQSGGRVLLSSL
jgi:hypothetical protein